jgi:superfamily II DNA or RNA helicase
MKTIKTRHVFKFKLYNGTVSRAEALIPNDYTYEKFSQNLKNLSVFDKNPQNYTESGFQSFVEAMILYFDDIIGIKNYETINSVRHKYKAHGQGNRGNCVVTTFLAFNGKEFLTDGNSQVTEYFAQSDYLDGFDLSSNEKIFNIFTDAKDFHENTKKNFVDSERTQVYGIEEIKNMVNNNIDFWLSYKNSLEDAKKEITPLKEPFIPDEYQETAIRDLLKIESGKFQVIWPTGTGKSEIMMEHSIRLIKKHIHNDPCSKILFVVPRITLGKQGIGKIIDRLMQYGIFNCTIINFTSGDYDNDNEARKSRGIEDVVNTTNIIELNKAINDANGPVFVFTTYHSVFKIIKAEIKFKLMNCDEAHNIVKGRSIPEDKRKIVVSENALRLCPIIVYYTATQGLSGTPDIPVLDGEGMDNIKLFGPVISRRSPREMIDCGKIVRPMVCHFTVTNAVLGEHINIHTATQEEITKNAEINAHIVWGAYQEVEKLNEKHSINSNLNAIKMLVKCSGGQSYSEIIKSKTFMKYQKDRPDVAIYAISSDWKIYRDGVEYPSNEENINKFMEELLEKKPDEKAIILHIAMVGEGWDVPGINAILPFGDMSDITSHQTVGRGERIHPFDRERILLKEILPSDCYSGKFFKPFCYVIMPRYLGFTDINRNNIETIVEQIQNNLGYCPYENINNEESYDGKMIIVAPPRIEKIHKEPELFEYEFNCQVLNSIEDKKKQNDFNKKIEIERSKIRSRLSKLVGDIDQIKPKFSGFSAINASNDFILTLPRKNIVAKGVVRKGNFVLLNGSSISSNTNMGISKSYLNERERLIKEGFINSKWIVVKDISFKSPSGAASVVAGQNMNGKTAWKCGKDTLEMLLNKMS